MATDFVLWIELEGFYASHHEAQQPLIVTRGKQVLDACKLARQRGVRAGMTVRHAKSILLQCLAKDWSPEPYEAASHAWLDICCGYCGLIEPIEQHVAALDLGDHPDPLDITESLIRELVQKTGLAVRYGFAASKWLACLAARRQDGGRALAEPAAFLSGLRVEDLLPVEPEIRERLRFLGYRTIGEAAAIPLSVLQEQFGNQGLVIKNAARGIGFQPIVSRASSPSSEASGKVIPSYPKESLHESFHTHGEVEDWQEVDRCFRLLAGRLGERLTKANLQSSRIRLRVDFGDAPSQDSHPPQSRGGDGAEMSRGFTKPLHNPLTILIALRLLAGEKIVRPVTRIWVTLSELEPVRQDQRRFHGLTGARPKAEKAVGFVREVFGEKAVLLGSEIEVPRPVRVMREWRRATGWR